MPPSPPRPPPRGLRSCLQPFQAASLAWCGLREAAPAPLDVHPLCRGVAVGFGQPHRVLYWTDGPPPSQAAASSSDAQGGQGARFGTSPPAQPPLDCRGGILAEEMGLGARRTPLPHHK